MIAEDVRIGLTKSPKSLPPYLLYDDAGSRLYEQITELPEYYLTRAEREIFVERGPAIAERVTREAGGPLRVVELGAGSATKTEVLLRAILDRQATCTYVPIDVSDSALADAERRLRGALPRLEIRPLVMTHELALRSMGRAPLRPPSIVLFIGSSVGNLEDREASALFRLVGEALGPRTWLLLGTDLRKDETVLLPAYDDAAGITAAFNKNVLARINRELGGHFDLARFRHRALWNEAASRVEMHLESTALQDVAIDRLELRARFLEGETIHTESSVKYDLPRVSALLGAGGFRVEETFYDRAHRFAVHLATYD